MAVEVGDEAPDFELKDQHGTPVRLSSFRGQKNVVLVFYPLAFSGVCSGEMCAMRDDFPEMAGHRFAALVESVPLEEGEAPTLVVVDWAVYGPGPFTYGWALGGAARLAWSLQPGQRVCKEGRCNSWRGHM